MKRVVILIGIFSISLGKLSTIGFYSRLYSSALSLICLTFVFIAFWFIFTSKNINSNIYLVICDSVLFASLITDTIIASFYPHKTPADIFFTVTNIILLLSLFLLDFTTETMTRINSKMDISSHHPPVISELKSTDASVTINQSCRNTMSININQSSTNTTINNDNNSLSPVFSNIQLYNNNTNMKCNDSYIYDGFRIKLNRLPRSSISNKNNNTSNMYTAPSSSSSGSNSVKNTHHTHITTPSSSSSSSSGGSIQDIPMNVNWNEFHDIHPRMTSSSCHIYTATWKNIPIVIKIIKSELMSCKIALSEFEMEAHTLSRIHHPHIIKLLGTGIHPQPFLILELLTGGTLAQRMGNHSNTWQPINIFRNTRMSYYEALKDAYTLASSLYYLHHQWCKDMHIIHRDLKPDNIGYTSDGILKLFDFGLCACVKTCRKKRTTQKTVLSTEVTNVNSKEDLDRISATSANSLVTVSGSAMITLSGKEATILSVKPLSSSSSSSANINVIDDFETIDLQPQLTTTDTTTNTTATNVMTSHTQVPRNQIKNIPTTSSSSSSNRKEDVNSHSDSMYTSNTTRSYLSHSPYKRLNSSSPSIDHLNRDNYTPENTVTAIPLSPLTSIKQSIFDIDNEDGDSDTEEIQDCYKMTGNTGTLRYMAPEVALGHSYHRSVDVFSFAIIFWQLLTGRVPFLRLGKKPFMDRIIIGGERPILNPSWPSEIQNLLLRCWDVDMNKRMTFKEIMRILHPLLQQEYIRQSQLEHTSLRVNTLLNSTHMTHNIHKYVQDTNGTHYWMIWEKYTLNRYVIILVWLVAIITIVFVTLSHGQNISANTFWLLSNLLIYIQIILLQTYIKSSSRSICLYLLSTICPKTVEQWCHQHLHIHHSSSNDDDTTLYTPTINTMDHNHIHTHTDKIIHTDEKYGHNDVIISINDNDQNTHTTNKTYPNISTKTHLTSIPKSSDKTLRHRANLSPLTAATTEEVMTSSPVVNTVFNPITDNHKQIF